MYVNSLRLSDCQLGHRRSSQSAFPHLHILPPPYFFPSIFSSLHIFFPPDFPHLHILQPQSARMTVHSWTMGWGWRWRCDPGPMLLTWNKKKVLVELLSHCCTGRGRERSEVRYHQPAIFNCYPRLGVQAELLLSLKVILDLVYIQQDLLLFSPRPSV